jgi:Retrotransposon gag protein
LEARNTNQSNGNSNIIVGNMEHDAIRVPIFSGRPTENPQDWLEKYDNIAVFKNWDDAAKLKHVPLFLDETARNWYRIADATTKGTWNAFKAKFLEVFEQVRYRQRVEIQLQNRVHESNESPMKYYFDVL